MKINFLEICQPEYFAGHYLPIISVPINETTTREELSKAIERLFRGEFKEALNKAFEEIQELQNANFFDPTEVGEMHVYFTIQYLQK